MRKPVILLGAGARGCNLEPLLALGVPILTSWAAKDMIDNEHLFYFGSPGQYGQRHANKVLYHADTIYAVGNRLSIWNVGYEGPRSDQRVVVIDVDPDPSPRFRVAQTVKSTVAAWLATLPEINADPAWIALCMAMRREYPLIESCHADARGFINSYRFVNALHKHLKPDQVMVSDCGGVMCPVFQVLRVKPPQRLMTSGGLGEMGCGLPAAIGASFARDRGEVLCFMGDGSMMLNLQELQTIIHHQLPIKIIVFENDGYSMIKRTQKVAGWPYAGTDRATGVSLPSFRALAHTLGFAACEVTSWDDFNRAIPALMASRVPALVEYHMDPEQAFMPKLDPIYVDGKPTSPRFDDMSPRL